VLRGTLAFLLVWFGMIPGFISDAAKTRSRLLKVAKDLEAAGHTAYAENIRKALKERGVNLSTEPTLA